MQRRADESEHSRIDGLMNLRFFFLLANKQTKNKAVAEEEKNQNELITSLMSENKNKVFFLR